MISFTSSSGADVPRARCSVHRAAPVWLSGLAWISLPVWLGFPYANRHDEQVGDASTQHEIHRIGVLMRMLVYMTIYARMRAEGTSLRGAYGE